MDLVKIKSSQFEELVFILLLKLGFTDLKWIGAAGSDSGRDIEAIEIVTDLSGITYQKKWFVECKKYSKGVPPTKISDKLMWAESNNIDVFLIATTSYLTRGSYELIENDIKNKKINFDIRLWEKPKIEELILRYPDSTNFLLRNLGRIIEREKNIFPVHSLTTSFERTALSYSQNSLGITQSILGELYNLNDKITPDINYKLGIDKIKSFTNLAIQYEKDLNSFILFANKGASHFRLENIELQDLLNKLIGSNQMIFKSKGHKINTMFKQVKLTTYSSLIELLLSKIIDNSFRYSPNKSVLEFDLKGNKNGFKLNILNRLNLYQDIDINLLGQIGYRSAAGMEANKQGLGIGFFLAKTICRELGFSIRWEIVKKINLNVIIESK